MAEREEAIQLLSGSRRRLDVAVPGEKKPIYLGVVILVIVSALFGLVIFYLSSLREKMAILDKEAVSLENKRDKKFEQEALVWNKRLSLVGGLIKNHIIWSESLKKIEALTPSEVQFTNFSATLQDDRIEIKGTAPSYTVIARAIAALSADPNFTDVVLNKIAGLSSGLLEYDMRVSFNRKKFLLGSLGGSPEELVK